MRKLKNDLHKYSPDIELSSRKIYNKETQDTTGARMIKSRNRSTHDKKLTSLSLIKHILNMKIIIRIYASFK